MDPCNDLLGGNGAFIEPPYMPNKKEHHTEHKQSELPIGAQRCLVDVPIDGKMDSLHRSLHQFRMVRLVRMIALSELDQAVVSIESSLYCN